jgi:hypothetical protein
MRVRAISVAAAALLAVGVGAGVGVAGPAGAAGAGPPSDIAATFTPQLATDGTDGSVEQIRHLAQCGPTMYAVGEFSQIKKTTTVVTRNNAFSFATKNGVISSWDPNVNGRVDTVALSADCSTAYLGGTFTSIGGTAVKNIAAVSTATGAVIPTFAHSASGRVTTLAVSGSHLLAGGYFTGINNTPKPYFASLSTTTGRDDNYLPDLHIAGTLPGNPSPTRIYNQQLSHDGTRDLIEGGFTSVSGQPIRQAFILDLGETPGLSTWKANDFDTDCHPVEPFYAQDGAWSPDDSKVYFGTTGYRPATGVTIPQTGPCDAALAFNSTPEAQGALWINYTGCDSLYSVEADASTAYFAGHERWSSNTYGCDGLGSGGVVAPGIEGLSPDAGALTFNPTRGRGLGADDMLVTSQGLWIASDNQANTNNCGKTALDKPSYGHAGLCLLPYTS